MDFFFTPCPGCFAVSQSINRGNEEVSPSVSRSAMVVTKKERKERKERKEKKEKNERNKRRERDEREERKEREREGGEGREGSGEMMGMIALMVNIPYSVRLIGVSTRRQRQSGFSGFSGFSGSCPLQGLAPSGSSYLLTVLTVLKYSNYCE